MKVEGPEVYKLAFTPTEFEVLCAKGTNKFSGLATSNMPKLYIASIEKKGVRVVPVTLHLGLGSFRPVEVEDLSKHKMDSEYYEIPQSTVDAVNRTIDNKGHVFVAGTSGNE